MTGFGKMGITASNDLNEETLDALNKQVKALGACQILPKFFLYMVTKKLKYI